MCCEAFKRASGEAGEDPLPKGTEFQTAIESGMHAMAQPLTLLRSYFYLAQAGAPLSRRMLDDATAGLEQLCLTFRLMQELVAVRSMAARFEDVALAAVLAQLTEDAEVIFAGADLALEVEFEPGFPPHLQPASSSSQAAQVSQVVPHDAEPALLRIDPARTRRTILGMLHVVRGGAMRPSSVRCRLRLDSAWFEIAIEPQHSLLVVDESSFDEVSRLHLALAVANARSEGAKLEVRSHPFALLLRLPVKSALARSVA